MFKLIRSQSQPLSWRFGLGCITSICSGCLKGLSVTVQSSSRSHEISIVMGVFVLDIPEKTTTIPSVPTASRELPISTSKISTATILNHPPVEHYRLMSIIYKQLYSKQSFLCLSTLSDQVVGGTDPPPSQEERQSDSLDHAGGAADGDVFHRTALLEQLRDDLHVHMLIDARSTVPQG